MVLGSIVCYYVYIGNLKMEEEKLLKPFTCSVCSKKFLNERNMNKHMRNVHGLQVERNGRIKCPVSDCAFSCQNRHKLRFHLCDSSSHGIHLNSMRKRFKTVEDFYAWKADEEEATNSYFVMKNGTRSIPGKVKKMFFVCHRSGYHVSHGTGKRERGRTTCRINARCPAGIETLIENSEVSMTYYKTHLGHSNDVKHIYLSKKEKALLAEKILRGFSFNKIIEDIKKEGTFENRRIKLITKKDLHNIARYFKFLTDDTYSDLLNVNKWVNQVKEYSDSKIVTIYKPQGYIEPSLNLHRKDFMLCLMTGGQKHILQKLSKSAMYIDSTNSPNSYGFFLITVSAFGNCRTPFPIAYCITNRKDHVAMKTFFLSIKNQTGVLKATLLISGELEVYQNAWESIMGKPKRIMLSIPYITESWKENLHKIHGDEQKKNSVYECLVSISREVHESNFQALLNSFITLVENDPELQEFGDYFKQFFANTTFLWAFCHNKLLDLDAFDKMVELHNTFHNICFDKEIPKGMDSCIRGLLQITHDKVLEQFCKLNEKPEVTAKILKRHEVSEQALRLHIDYLDAANIWLIKCPDYDDSTYTVEKRISLSDKCRFFCSLCEGYLDWYFCNCVNYLLENEICEHVHAIARMFGTKCEDVTGKDADITVPTLDNTEEELDELHSDFTVSTNYLQSKSLPEKEYENVKIKVKECLKVFQSPSSSQ